MPELPEVEVLVRHLRPHLRGRTLRAVEVRHARVVRPATIAEVAEGLVGGTVLAVRRRAKYLVFEMTAASGASCGRRTVLVHLGMTGRLYVQAASDVEPRHAVVLFDLGRERLVFEDARRFGRLLLDPGVLDRLGPEPLSEAFTSGRLEAGLRESRRPLKGLLMDQALVAGLGNIYACEALHRARLSPMRPGCAVTRPEVRSLRGAVRRTLEDAIRLGLALPLDFSGAGDRDGIFYYGTSGRATSCDGERFRVYDRAGLPCARCGTAIQRTTLAGRGTFWCPECQR